LANYCFSDRAVTAQTLRQRIKRIFEKVGILFGPSPHSEYCCESEQGSRREMRKGKKENCRRTKGKIK
jgi:hypothetical protein